MAWRKSRETADLIAQSKKAIAELLATAEELDAFVAALQRATEDTKRQEGDEPSE